MIHASTAVDRYITNLSEVKYTSPRVVGSAGGGPSWGALPAHRRPQTPAASLSFTQQPTPVNARPQLRHHSTTAAERRCEHQLKKTPQPLVIVLLTDLLLGNKTVSTSRRSSKTFETLRGLAQGAPESCVYNLLKLTMLLRS